MDKIWAWQPFGPDQSINSFMFIGNHYRGFPVIKVTDEQKQSIQSGVVFEFKFKGIKYVAVNGHIEKKG